MSNVLKLFATGLLAFAVMSVVGSARAQVEIRSARTIAETVCAECHQITPTAPPPAIVDPPAPSFRAIADRPQTTPDSLKGFMAHTEWDKHNRSMTLPLLLLAPAERGPLVDYILAQRSPPQH